MGEYIGDDTIGVIEGDFWTLDCSSDEVPNVFPGSITPVITLLLITPNSSRLDYRLCATRQEELLIDPRVWSFVE